MKNVTMCVIAILVLALGSVAAQAQQVILKATVPFDFTVGNTYFNSGEYILKSANHENREVLVWSRKDGKQAAFILTAPLFNVRGDQGKYVADFNCYGKECMLSEIWVGRDGHALSKTPHEIQLAQEWKAKNEAVDMAVGK